MTIQELIDLFYLTLKFQNEYLSKKVNEVDIPEFMKEKGDN